MLSVNVLCLDEFIQGQNQLTVSLVCKAWLSTGSFVSSEKKTTVETSQTWMMVICRIDLDI